MEDRIARVISYLFHPMLMPVYILILLLNLGSDFASNIPFKSKAAITGIMIFITILMPLVVTGFLYRMKMISSFYLEKQEERIYPLLIIGIFYYLAYYLLKGSHIYPVFSLYMLGSTLLIVFALVTTFYRKISLHMIGLGGLTGLLLGFSQHLDRMPYLLYGAVLLSGIVGSARLKIGAHKSSEIYSGFLMGAVVMFLLFCLV